MGATVAVGMSGGVDSSVAAALLREQGHDVVGVIMKVYDPSLGAGVAGRHACYGPDEVEDVEDARRVADSLGIPFHAFDLAAEYREHVLDYFRREYRAGRTPNPCVVCNRRLKFGFLVERATASGLRFDFFATGHYARLVDDGGRVRLHRGRDERKDQSYFLAYLTPAQLRKSLFPLGNLIKDEVRAHARRLGLPTAEKAESQDFVAGDHEALLGDLEPGPIVDRDGRVLGEHRGLGRYTVGQRRGIGIASSHPLYVVGLDAARNTVVVGGREETAGRALEASEASWSASDGPPALTRVSAKIRYNHRAAPATLTVLDGGRVRVEFDEPQFAITPGQSLVLYDGDCVLGAAVIDRAL